MKKRGDKIKRILLVMVYFSMLFYGGCGPTQSPDVIYVSGLKPLLLRNPGDPGAKYPDRWAVSDDPEGRDICGVAFGFVLQLTDENNEDHHNAGIRVDIEVVNHWSTGGYGDLWEQEAPNGEKYGFIKVSPAEDSGVYDGIVYGYTNSYGRLFVYPGLGDPEGSFEPSAPLDYGYEWPGPGGSHTDVVDTFVQLKITVPRKHMPMSPVYVWCHFVRAQYQSMWEPLGGVYGNSFSGIGELGGYSMQMQSLDSNTITSKLAAAISWDALGEFNIKKTSKGTTSDYSLNTKIYTGQAVTTMDTTSSEGPCLDWAHWYQLRWDSDSGQWYWDDPNKMHALWFADPNDPNNIIDTMTSCEPYVLWADVNLPEPYDANQAYSTVVLHSVNKTTGEVFSKMRIYMYLSSKSPDNKILTMFSDYVAIVERPEDQGYYYDKWGNPYVAIYAPQSSILEVDFPEPFGDFNADDKVDFYDFALFSNHYQDSVWDPNTNYDAMYEEPNNWDGQIDIPELGGFTENWLWQAGGPMMMGQEGMSQSLGFTQGPYQSTVTKQPAAMAQQAQPKLSPADIEELLKWLDELWLNGDLKDWTEQEYLEFRKAIEESSK